MSGTYHVVCRDCPTETIERSRDAALEEARTHRLEHDHRVTYDRVA
jgi:hypothetical protein